VGVSTAVKDIYYIHVADDSYENIDWRGWYESEHNE
jgi:hypothetical protein